MNKLVVIVSLLAHSVSIITINGVVPTVEIGLVLKPRAGKNQDRIGNHKVMVDGDPTPYYLVGVYDGHGPEGGVAAYNAKTKMWEYFQQSLADSGDIGSSLIRALNEIEEWTGKFSCFENSGTTAVNALIHNNLLYLSNIGDSRAVISRDGKAIQPLKDHGVENEEEGARIRAAGCEPTYKCHRHKEDVTSSACPHASDQCRIYGRVGGCRFTRSLADHGVKAQLKRTYGTEIILAQPELWVGELTPQDTFIILASDGVWDTIVTNPVYNQEAVDLVHNTLSAFPTRALGAQEAATALADLAKKRVAFDDIAVVVITLDWPEDESSSWLSDE